MNRLGDLPILRAAAGRIEVRAADAADDTIGMLVGHFSRFNQWYEIHSWWEGDFLERVAPGAFAQTIAEDLESMRVLFNHGMDPQYGMKVLGPIESLAEDSIGPAYEVGLLDTSYNRDLLPGLRANQYGSSMTFRVISESWVDEPAPSDYNPKALPERTITGARVPEFGPVTFPANPGADAGARSLTDEYYDFLRVREPERFEQMRGLILAGPAGRSDARSADGGADGGKPTPKEKARDNRLRLIQNGVL